MTNLGKVSELTNGSLVGTLPDTGLPVKIA